MVYWLLVLIITFILDLITSLVHRNRDKDLEIILLRQQVRILQRKVKTPLRITDPERKILSILVNKFSQSKKDMHQRLHQVMFIFNPETPPMASRIGTAQVDFQTKSKTRQTYDIV